MFTKSFEISIHALREEGDARRPTNRHSGTKFLSTPSARRATCYQFGPRKVRLHFYPRPPRGGRHLRIFDRVQLVVFLSTPSARRATGLVPWDGEQNRFLSTPSARRATKYTTKPSKEQRISIHALREEGDARLLWLHSSTVISIHALREEGDYVQKSLGKTHDDFYPRPPRGGRRRSHAHSGQRCQFLSTPSARRATERFGFQVREISISIHALREEGDLAALAVLDSVVGISIHALREEGDRAKSILPCPVSLFLSTPSARRATAGSTHCPPDAGNFYPRPPRGGRPDPCGRFRGQPDFYPRPPRGGRREWLGITDRQVRFLSTPSARRATILAAVYARMERISIHALREEGDLRYGKPARAI